MPDLFMSMARTSENAGNIKIFYLSLSLVIALSMSILLKISHLEILSLTFTATIAIFLEAIVNFLYKVAIGKPLFKYKYACIFKCNTSYLNLPMWYWGILILYKYSLLYKFTLNTLILSSLFSAIIIAIFLVISMFLRKAHLLSDKRLTALLFSFYFIFLLAQYLQFGISAVIASITFGLIAHTAEVLVNLFLKIITNDTYWYYTPPNYAKGLSSLNNIPFFTGGAWIFLLVLANLI